MHNKLKNTIGLPPMELAETVTPRISNAQINTDLISCCSVKKIVIIFIILFIGIISSYIILNQICGKQEDIKETNIIVATGSRTIYNKSVNNNYDMNILLFLKNKTHTEIARKKREIKKRRDVHYNSIDEIVGKFTEKDIQKARKTISNYNKPCQPGTEDDICKNIVLQLDKIKNKDKTNDKFLKIRKSELEEIKGKNYLNEIPSTEYTIKRDTFASTNSDEANNKPTPIMENVGRSASNSYVKLNNNYHQLYSGPLEAYNPVNNYPPASEHCLLAQLLKQNYPRVKMDHINPSYYDIHHVPRPGQMAYHSQISNIPWTHARDTDDLHEMKHHPQDIEISMRYQTGSPSILSNNATTREAECEDGMIPCKDGGQCVLPIQVCDGTVDCQDVSDEIHCSCKSLVDKSRLCDGYFDCPFGEDEMGCNGCIEDAFSCENYNINLHPTCFTKEQRCNGIRDCSNGKDEIECNLLAPSLHEKPLFAISNTEGYLQRNFKGSWYAVCKNPYMWAHDACLRETGLIIRPPYLQMVPIDPLMKPYYLNNGPGNTMQLTDTCYNSSAVYVTCPALLCGTRVPTTTQLLRESTENRNRLLGRNKRYLCNIYPTSPYCRRRTKRQSSKVDSQQEGFQFGTQKLLKRSESRVVGGQASEPAAWPWMVALYRDGSFFCGGVIITNRWVMSAAHCVRKFWEHYYEIKVGMLRRFSFSPQEQNHKVSHIIVNQNYDRIDMKNDLCLLRVKPSILFSRWVRPVCLPGVDTAGPDWMNGPPAGVTCTAVGWGALVEKGPDPDHMREVEVPIWNDCKHREDRAGNEICAGYVEGGKDACQGDSGGPLLCKNPHNTHQWYIAGIVSHGQGCGREGEPGVYTRVSLFVQWIQHHINSKSLPNVRPKQECPGFRCMSGISKCIPRKRMCDKFVDCLDGEDEKDCNFSSTPQDNIEKILLTSDLKDSNDDSTEKISRKIDHNIPNNSERSVNDFTTNNITYTPKNIEINDVANSTTKEPQGFLNPTINNESNNITIVSDNIIKNTEEKPIFNISVIENPNNSSDTDINTNPTSISHLEPSSIKTQSDNELNANDEYVKGSDKTTTSTNNSPEISTENITSDPTDSISSHSSEEESEVIPTDTTNMLDNNNTFETIENHLTTNTSKQFRRTDIPESIDAESSFAGNETSMKDKDELNNNFLSDNKQTTTPNEGNSNSDDNTIEGIINSDIDKGNEQKIINNKPNIDNFTINLPTNKSNFLNKGENGDLPEKHHILENNNTFVLGNNNTLFGNNITKSNLNNNISDFSKNINKDLHNIHDGNTSSKPLNINQLEENKKGGLNDDEEKEGKAFDIDLSHESQIGDKPGQDSKTESSFINHGKDKQVLLGQKLLPAKMKKSHIIPEHFECKRISQFIPYKHRCDHNADCEDGTDELGCTCVDYITTFDDSLLCDNHIDCADGQDEMNCYGCSDGQFLCKWSQNCLPSKFVCDGIPHCPRGEDELDCYTLSNGRNIICDIDGKPKVNLEGYLTKKHNNKWNIVCEDNLTLGQQEEASKHICRYLGFNSANRFFVKYINIKENDITSVEKYVRKRDALEIPIEFIFKDTQGAEARHIIIKDPQIIKEECVPNVTKTCMSLYVYCEHSLYTDFSEFSASQFRTSYVRKYENDILPWVAKVYVEGDYKCSGILIDLSWVLVSESCLWDTLLIYHYVSVVLGSQRILSSTSGPFEQIHQVDAKKDIYTGSLTLLHLKTKAHYTAMVKPMITSTYNSYSLGKKDLCVAVGQDLYNHTVKVYLEETLKCSPRKRCFRKIKKGPTCDGSKLSRPWSGIITCHAEQGWYPAASFVERRGECESEENIIGNDIEEYRIDVKHYIASYKHITNQTSVEVSTDDYCNGHRCTRGRCIPFVRVCDGVRDCEDGSDESDNSCGNKHNVCTNDPYLRGCECTSGELKCKNGRCIAKDLFNDGHDDCGDGSDERMPSTCAYYLTRTAPKRLCDGILQCHDRTDEDPVFCKCFAKTSYKCGKSDECVAPDLVCDGVRDCPNGEDEQKCLGLKAPEGSAYGTGEVIIRTHGEWHTKCFTTNNHTKTQLEEICKKLGFQSGHAKQLRSHEKLNAYTKVIVDKFSKVVLNNNTSLMIRNSNKPIARVVLDDDISNCYPLFIECL